MKRSLFNLLLGVLVLSASAQDSTSYHIDGVLKDVDVTEVYLIYYGNHGVAVDSAQVINHQYALNGPITSGMVATLTTTPPPAIPGLDNIVSIFVNPAEHFAVTHTGAFNKMTITGSPANTEYQRILTREKDFQQQQKALEEKIGKAMAAKDKATAQQLRAELETWTAMENDYVYGDYMRANPSSPLLVYAFNNYIGDPSRLLPADVEKVQPLFNMLPKSLRNAAGGKVFQQRLDNLTTFDQTVSIGKPAPDFTQNDTSGNPVTLSSFRGKYVLLDFWASWCGPCRMENPNVVAAYKKYHPKGFEIIGISLDQQDQAWKKAIRDDQLIWTHVSDLKYWNNALVKLYGVQGVPQNFLIDPNGKIIARGLRGEDLDKKLEEAYGLQRQSIPPDPAIRMEEPAAKAPAAVITDWKVIDTSGFYRRQVIKRNEITLVFIDKSGGFDTTLQAKMIETFFTVYPREMHRFNPHSLKQVTFVIDPAYHGVAATQAGIIRFDPSYFRKFPRDVDVVTHESMHVVQDYKSPEDGWITEGIADYARYRYGVDNTGGGWQLPLFDIHQKYTDSYRVTARFFTWLEKNIDPAIVDKLDAVMRKGKYEPAIWKKWTGKTIDELWDRYAKNDLSDHSKE